VWRGMTKAERRPWELKARQEKIRHAKDHPDYKFTPKASGKRQRHSKPAQRRTSGRKARHHSRSTSPVSDTSQTQRQQLGEISRASSAGSSVAQPQIITEDIETMFATNQNIFAPVSQLGNPAPMDADLTMPDWLSPQSSGTLDPLDLLYAPELLSPSASSAADSLVSMPFGQGPVHSLTSQPYRMTTASFGIISFHRRTFLIRNTRLWRATKLKIRCYFGTNSMMI
jgi:hypothetical protein